MCLAHVLVGGGAGRGGFVVCFEISGVVVR